jgi:hypothetical protein
VGSVWNVKLVDGGDGAPTGIINYNFRGDALDVVRTSNGQVFVSVRRVCDALGINFARQSVKLWSDPAATVGEMSTVGADGKRRHMLGIEVRSLPLWVATIHPNKVKASAREKLIEYKRDAAEVLADHFLGKRGSDAGILNRLDAMIRENLRLRNAMKEKETFYEADRRLLAEGQRSTICDAEFDEVRGLLLEVVDLWLALGRADTKRAALQLVKHRAIPGAFSKGFRLRFLPREQVPGILRALEVLRSDAEAEVRRLGALPKKNRKAQATRVPLDPGIVSIKYGADGVSHVDRAARYALLNLRK